MEVVEEDGGVCGAGNRRGGYCSEFGGKGSAEKVLRHQRASKSSYFLLPVHSRVRRSFNRAKSRELNSGKTEHRTQQQDFWLTKAN